MKDLKYLAAYLVPAFCVAGLLLGGWMSISTLLFVFALVPILEPLVGRSTANLSDNNRAQKLNQKFFDWLLYLNVPIVYGIIVLFIWILNTQSLSNLEYTGHILSVGLVLGACGINVGHELGHRQNKKDQTVAKILLLPSWYMHFFIEHNRGHHKNIATDLDPASARKGENLYFFWLRSVYFSYLDAWKLENKRLRRKGIPFLSMENEMLVFTLIQLLYLCLVIAIVDHFWGLFAVVMAGVAGFLLLETINYIEHYGLRRQKLASGRYERVQAKHSWNADYQMGRILLYELTRHSDHHFIATKKYQLLDHHDEAPELPLGYPTSMLLALVPPLWFGIMNKRIPEEKIT
jgi:alkane 1-monooxygenase